MKPTRADWFRIQVLAIPAMDFSPPIIFALFQQHFNIFINISGSIEFSCQSAMYWMVPDLLFCSSGRKYKGRSQDCDIGDRDGCRENIGKPLKVRSAFAKKGGHWWLVYIYV